MIDIKSDNDSKSNERIEARIPDGLILKKSVDPSTRDVTIYDLIAHYVGLRYVRKDIYVDESGEEYIRTKYGFQSSIQYNQNIQIIKSDRLIDELQYKFKIAKEKADQYGEIIKILEAKNRERKEKLEKLFRLFQDENETLRQEIKQLKRELAEFKQATESIIGKLTRLINQTKDKPGIEKSTSTELDWSTYNDIFDDKEL
jgi:hypothetical protein